MSVPIPPEIAVRIDVYAERARQGLPLFEDGEPDVFEQSLRELSTRQQRAKRRRQQEREEGELI